jgi:hypothetical protein
MKRVLSVLINPPDSIPCSIAPCSWLYGRCPHHLRAAPRRQRQTSPRQGARPRTPPIRPHQLEMASAHHALRRDCARRTAFIATPASNPIPSSPHRPQHLCPTTLPSIPCAWHACVLHAFTGDTLLLTVCRRSRACGHTSAA